MAPNKRQKRPPITIEDIKVRHQKLPKKYLKEIDRQQCHFRIFYDVTLSDKCCHKKNSIIVATKDEIWELPREERGMKMKELTIAALRTHKRNAGRGCPLNCDTDINLLLRMHQFWDYLWSHGESLVNSSIAAIHQRSVFLLIVCSDAAP
jgi:hypothetical protein